MANIEILQQKLVSLAEEIRAKTGTTGSLSLDDMFTAINNIQIGGTAEISYGNKLKNKLVSIANAIRAKTGGTAPLTLDEMIAAIKNLVLQMSGAVIPSSYFTIGTHNIVTRQGNLVTVDVQLVPEKSSIAEGTPLFTLPNGWKPKESITFIAIYPNILDATYPMELVCSLNSEGQASATQKNNTFNPVKTLLCQFEFEAI